MVAAGYCLKSRVCGRNGEVPGVSLHCLKSRACSGNGEVPGVSLHCWWQWWRRPWGVALLVEGTIEGNHVLAARDSRVKTQSFADVR
jgi:hypothetical protein